jgi:hypothetical protein
VAGKVAAMKLENGTLDRSAVLLAQLKTLVDSFPHQQRTDLIETLKIVFSGLDAGEENRHSVHLQPEVSSAFSSRFREAPASRNSSNKPRNENQKQKEGGER